MRLALKIATAAGLTTVLLLPLGMIRGTVHDRQRHRAAAVETVARSTAGGQVVAGPVLVVPYSDRIVTLRADADGTTHRVVKDQAGAWVFFPESLQVDGHLRPLPRRLGLHEVRVYEFDAQLRASLRARIPRDEDPASPRTIGQPILGVAISDVRGVVGKPVLKANGRLLSLQQGLGYGDGRGLHALLEAPAEGSTLTLDIEFSSTLQGTESASIVPLADHNVIALASSWPHPRFHGEFLPRAREVGAAGFDGTWEISSLASNAQAGFRNALVEPATAGQVEKVSVSLVDPVDVYTQVDRATKYGVLFVLLTFVSFFMFEFLKQLRIHPIQYGLVGLAIAIFFLLLLALSEHIAFGLAYLAAGAACIALIGYYLRFVLGGWARGAGFAGLLGTLYAALYGLLVSEDNAMVLGAGLLFLVLAILMVLTRKVDWYQASSTGAGARGEGGSLS
jgi:inner membrane protein